MKTLETDIQLLITGADIGRPGTPGKSGAPERALLGFDGERCVDLLTSADPRRDLLRPCWWAFSTSQ